MTSTSKKYSTLKQILAGNYRVAEFALTNICRSKCSFCHIWEQHPKVIVPNDAVRKTINNLANIGVRFITLTGGEPLLHPNIIQIVQQCTARNRVTAVLSADPMLITSDIAFSLAKAQVDYVCFSFDHYTDEIEYQSRHLTEMVNKIFWAVGNLRNEGIKAVASIVICKFNFMELEQLFDFCKSAGFDAFSINYPETSISPTYQLGGEAVNLPPTTIADALQQIITLKQRGWPVLNPIPSMQNIIHYLRNEPVEYPCLGGNKVLFVDWNCDVYPCMHLDSKICSSIEISKEHLLSGSCNSCSMSWYRDFSVFQAGFKSIIPALHSLHDFSTMQ